MGSFATITTTNISISPVRVTYNSVDLGATEGDVTVSIELPNAEIKVSQYGDTLIDLVNKGAIVKAKFRLLEVTPANLKNLYPAAFKVGSTGLYVASNVGYKLSAYASALVLHPLEKADNDYSKDVKFFKAISMSPAEIPYSAENITGLDVEMLALPDFTPGAQARFAILGDPTVGLTNASAAAAVAGGGNTGNGTVGSITVYNATTLTETITLTCVDEGANSGEFHVTGGDGRSLGIATVGVAFTADDNSITLTISDGATDFAEGDTFTIATTAANWI